MLLLIFFSLLPLDVGSLVPPCPNKISLAHVSTEKGKGVIEISVRGGGRYICTLNIERGSGLQKVGEKNGSGISVVKFRDLSPESIYLVQVEFLDEKTPHCSKLQLSEIVINKD